MLFVSSSYGQTKSFYPGKFPVKGNIPSSLNLNYKSLPVKNSPEKKSLVKYSIGKSF